MALRYVEKLQGYIADVPDIDFTRCDGRLFHFDQVNTAGVSTTAEQQTINGGQGSFPLAIIDTNKNSEFTFASSQFTMEMFEMANATNMTQKDVGVTESKRYTVESGQTVTLPFEVQAGSVKITGMEQAENAAAGKFAVAITAATEEKGGSTVITFAGDDATVGDVMRVGYTRRAVNAHVVNVKTTSTTARGEVIFHYPVYSAGVDCTESAVKGLLHVKAHRVRVTALPGFDTSYKTAATNSVTFTAMDPQRPDQNLLQYIYEEYGEDGAVVAVSDIATENVAWN